MYKPIKRLYFWLKSKVYKMDKKDKKEQFKLLEYDLNIIKSNLMSYFNRDYFKDYLSLIIETDYGIDFKIGFEKFSLIWVRTNKIYLKTYHWILDLSIVGNYKKLHIENLDIIVKDHNAFINSYADFYFENLEKYIEDEYLKDDKKLDDLIVNKKLKQV
jgi:hypothetical protein